MNLNWDELPLSELVERLLNAAAPNSADELERVCILAKQLEQSDRIRDADRAYVRGACELSLELARGLRGRLVSETVQAVGRRHGELLRQLRLNPGSTRADLGETLKISNLALDTGLSELYDANLIEPTAPPEGGLSLTLLGERVFVSIASALLVAPPPAPPSTAEFRLVPDGTTSGSEGDSASATVHKLGTVMRLGEQIEIATRDLFNISRKAVELCAAVDAHFSFDFSAVQIIRHTENTIETIAGTGTAKQWVGHAKHRIEFDSRLRDIQADIVLEKQVEVVSGSDDHRLDPLLRKVYRHERLARVFVPLVLVRDANGRILPDADVWRPAEDKRVLKDCSCGRCQSNLARKQGDSPNVLRLSPGPGEFVEVIGSFEAGFLPLANGAPRKVALRSAHMLANFVTRHANSIYDCLLGGVLERVAEMARLLAGADIATVQWGTNGSGGVIRHWHTVGTGENAQQMMQERNLRGAIGGFPRQGGLGAKALLEGQPKTLSRDLEVMNEGLFKQGIRATAVFPSVQATVPTVGEKVCLVYTHYRQEREFSPEELKWVHYLARRSGDLLRMASEQADARDHDRRLAAMHRVVNALSSRHPIPSSSRKLLRPPGDGVRDLVWEIAGWTLNLFGADVVSIYLYDSRVGTLSLPPMRAGRLRCEVPADQPLKESDAPMLVLSQGHQFAPEVEGHPNLDPQGRPDGFVPREGIRSSAGLLLEVDGQPVGVMFVNYRDIHEFVQLEKDQLELLANLCAQALKNYDLAEPLVDEPKIEQLAVTSLVAVTPLPN